MVNQNSRRNFIQQSAQISFGGLLATQIPAIAKSAGDQPDYYSLGQRGYETARRPFNTEVSLKPKIIAACENDNHVVTAVNRARNEGLPISVKSRGHSFEGFSLNDNGVVIELSRISQPLLKSDHRFLSGPGITLGDVYSFLIPKGRLLPAGSCSGVGLGGLTLGGGYGIFAREFGLTCDLLERVRMVDGRSQIVDSADDPDLLWACRGGGNGNFGAITSMEFGTVEAPENLSAQRFTSGEVSVADALRKTEQWFAMAHELPDPIFSGFIVNGKNITVLLTSTFSHTGPAFRNAAAAITAAGFTSKGPTSNPTQTAIKRYYGAQSPLPFRNFCGGMADSFQDYAPALPAVFEEAQRSGLMIQINTLGGKISRGAGGAYPHRQRQFMSEVQAYWNSPSQRDAKIAGAERMRAHLAKVISAHYRNYPSVNFPNWEEAYYGKNYARLQELKLRYDPDNLFSHPQSVRLPEKKAVARPDF